ncbi:MAG TPA: aminotransferase class V-fold PLP-dependent enzyme [Thermoleophilaceae bacterium]|nr:aminotransferase class V-fold PLP-dependent enzyme [Thermoleophilaceae bacterium]
MLERIAFLNAGTDGPAPRRAVEAVADEVERQVAEGRYDAYFARRVELREHQRDAYAALLGCPRDELSLTTTTTEGMATLIAGFGSGDRIVTSDEEHPGVFGPLARARERGAEVTVAPFARLHEAVTPETTAVVCCHVSWVSGAVAPVELRELEVPVIYDGAQAVGAIAVDVKGLRCAAYAGSGQKWLCGPDGSGILYVDPSHRERVPSLVPSYWNLADPDAGLDAQLHPNARAWDNAGLSGETSRYALESLAVLDETGWDRVHADGPALAARLAELLREAGYGVAERGRTTLVSWEDDDPAAVKARAAEAGVVIRSIPNRPLLRASVGAWNDESDLERLLAVA